MIAAWMLWSIGAGLLFVVAALAADRLLSRGRRWAWAAVAAGTVALPAVRFLAGAGATPDAPPPTFPIALEPLAVTVAGDSALHSLDGALLAAWAVLSACLALWALLGTARLAHRRRSWRAGTLRGRPVLWSRDAGPAVVGLAAPRIVLPEWVRDADPARQELILAHEEEHMRARDVHLRFATALALLAFPWNPALWFQYRRLTAAVEIDCDRRVVDRMPHRRRLYGDVLLEVGARPWRPAGAAMAAMSQPRSFLERRLRNLLRRAPQVRLAQAALLAFAAVFVVGLALTLPGIGRSANESPPPAPEAPPAPPSAPTTEPHVSDEPTFTPYTAAPRFLDAAAVRQSLADEYPPLLRDAGVGGTVQVHIFVNETGAVDKAQVANGSGHAALDAAALRVAESMAFSPAKLEDDPTPAWILLPITFLATPGDAPSSGDAGPSPDASPPPESSEQSRQ